MSNYLKKTSSTTKTGARETVKNSRGKFIEIEIQAEKMVFSA